MYEDIVRVLLSFDRQASKDIATTIMPYLLKQ